MARGKYSTNLCDFLEKMLVVDEKNRPDVDNLYGVIEELCQGGVVVAHELFSSHDSPMHSQHITEGAMFPG